MKKLFLLAFIAFGAITIQAQIFSWGIKGGINSSKISFDDFNVDASGVITIDPDYFSVDNSGIITIDANAMTIDPATGQVTYVNPDIVDVSAPSVQFSPSSYEVGFHAGLFTRFKIAGIFLQPEVYYSMANASIDISSIDSFSDAVDAANDLESEVAKAKYHNIDIPILVGVKLGPLRLNAGPVASFKLSKSISEASSEVEDMLEDFTSVTSAATFGGQAGIGLDILKRVSIDVRYEFPLSKLGDSVEIGGETFNTDQRQSQFLVSLGIIFGKKKD